MPDTLGVILEVEMHNPIVVSDDLEISKEKIRVEKVKYGETMEKFSGP